MTLDHVTAMNNTIADSAKKKAAKISFKSMGDFLKVS